MLSHSKLRIPLLQRLRGFHGKAQLSDGAAFTIRGKAKETGVHMVKLKLELEDHLERIIDVPVEGGYTSLVNLDIND